MTREHDRSWPLDIAVVGSGISGMACAWLLSQAHSVTLYEAAPRLGGHTNTVEADGQAVDTGFIVYNEATYPNLTALFASLGVATQPTDMTFAVSLDAGRLEYSGTDLGGLFAQRSNLVNPRFLWMLRDLLRFYREAPARMARLEGLSLGEFLSRDGYGRAFRDDHLLPMAAAIWSAPARTLLDYPAASFVRFCDNHGLLKVKDRPVWRTVTGGSRSYVRVLTAPYASRIRLGAPVAAVGRGPAGPTVAVRGEVAARHDHVVIAAHADQALEMLAAPTERDRAILGAFRYAPNIAYLHTDARLMPRRRAVWSAWNYLGRRREPESLCVTYWMNRLQALPGPREYFVTLNPPFRPNGVVREEAYAHPIFDQAALAAQSRIWSLQGEGNVWFCGAHFGAGFHEDGLQAGLAVAEAIGGVRRPWSVPGESGRIALPRDVAARAAA